MKMRKFADRIIAFFSEAEGNDVTLTHQQVQTMVVDEGLSFKELVELYDILASHYNSLGDMETFQMISVWWMPTNPLGNSPVNACWRDMSLQEQFESIEWLMGAMPWPFVAGKLHILISELKIPAGSVAAPLTSANIIGVILSLPFQHLIGLDDLRTYMQSHLKAIKALV